MTATAFVDCNAAAILQVTATTSVSANTYTLLLAACNMSVTVAITPWGTMIYEDGGYAIDEMYDWEHQTDWSNWIGNVWGPVGPKCRSTFTSIINGGLLRDAQTEPLQVTASSSAAGHRTVGFTLDLQLHANTIVTPGYLIDAFGNIELVATADITGTPVKLAGAVLNTTSDWYVLPGSLYSVYSDINVQSGMITDQSNGTMFGVIRNMEPTSYAVICNQSTHANETYDFIGNEIILPGWFSSMQILTIVSTLPYRTITVAHETRDFKVLSEHRTIDVDQETRDLKVLSYPYNA